MGTLNERDKHREQRDQLTENRFVADDPKSMGFGRLRFDCGLGGLALLAWFAFGTATPTINNSPSINAPATSPPTPPVNPERQPPTNP